MAGGNRLLIKIGTANIVPKMMVSLT